MDNIFIFIKGKQFKVLLADESLQSRTPGMITNGMAFQDMGHVTIFLQYIA